MSARLKRSQAAIKYRDGQMILLQVLPHREQHLRRAGFHAHVLELRRDDDSVVEAELWIQDEPRLTDFLNAALLLFDDEPGALTW